MGLITTFIVFRGSRWNKSNFILIALFNICLITITINPNILNALRDVLSLQKAYRGRIIALLIVSNILNVDIFYFLKINNVHIKNIWLCHRHHGSDYHLYCLSRFSLE